MFAGVWLLLRRRLSRTTTLDRSKEEKELPKKEEPIGTEVHGSLVGEPQSYSDLLKAMGIKKD